MQKESPRWFAGKRWLPTERSHSFRALPGSAFRAFCRRVPNLVDGLFDGVAQRFALVGSQGRPICNQRTRCGQLNLILTHLRN